MNLVLSLTDLGSSFWGMVFILASTNLLATRIAAGCFLLALVVVLFYAENVCTLYHLITLFQILLGFVLSILIDKLNVRRYSTVFLIRTDLVCLLICAYASCSGCFVDSV